MNNKTIITFKPAEKQPQTQPEVKCNYFKINPKQVSCFENLTMKNITHILFET